MGEASLNEALVAQRIEPRTPKAKMEVQFFPGAPYNFKMKKKFKKVEWDKAAEWWNNEVGDIGAWHQYIDIDPAIFKILGNIRNKIILEIGCGNGYFSRLLAKKGARVMAIDISKKLLDFAIIKEKEKSLNINYFVRDAAKLYGIKSKYFDIAIANMSLMDIADARNTIKEVSRVLKQKGHFVFSITHPVFHDEFHQQWTIIREDKKKYFARAISRYLSTTAEKRTLWLSGVKATHYHRSLETYSRYLRDANLLINGLWEIATKKEIVKARKEDSNTRLRRSRYSTLAEKRMKEFAKQEIPMFLIIDALKYK